MKIRFTIARISGIQLFSRFALAVKEENVGWDDMDNARLSEDGNTWITAWSGFHYTILNPESAELAVVEYDGACRGFLTQNLIPSELKGETTHAEVIEGSALTRHEAKKFEHPNAYMLVEAYRLMQKASKHENALHTSLASAEARMSIIMFISSEEGLGKNAVFVRTGSNDKNGNPSVFVTCSPGGEQVTLEIQLNFWGLEATIGYVVGRVIPWLKRLKPVLLPYDDVAAVA